MFKKRNAIGETKQEYDKRVRETEKLERNRKKVEWTTKLERMREEYDKRPRPLMEDLMAMEMSECVALRRYSEDTGPHERPTMVRTGDWVTRVPGGWIYQFIIKQVSYGGGAGISTVFIPLTSEEKSG